MELKTEIGMPLDEFVRLYETEGPFELINGERKPLMVTVAGHGAALKVLYFALSLFVSARKLGEVLSEVPFVISYTSNWVTGSRTPDIMYYAAERIDAYKEADPDWKQKPYIMVPDLVVEIMSPTDNLSELDEKIDQYLLDGVRAAWVVDLQKQKVSIYVLNARTPFIKQQTSLKSTDTLSGGDTIPGFEMIVASIFA